MRPHRGRRRALCWGSGSGRVPGPSWGPRVSCCEHPSSGAPGPHPAAPPASARPPPPRPACSPWVQTGLSRQDTCSLPGPDPVLGGEALAWVPLRGSLGPRGSRPRGRDTGSPPASGPDAPPRAGRQRPSAVKAGVCQALTSDLERLRHHDPLGSPERGWDEMPRTPPSRAHFSPRQAPPAALTVPSASPRAPRHLPPPRPDRQQPQEPSEAESGCLPPEAPLHVEPNQGHVRPQDCLSAPWLHRAGAGAGAGAPHPPAPLGCLHGDPEGPCPARCVRVCGDPGLGLRPLRFSVLRMQDPWPWRPPLSATSLLDGLIVPVEDLLPAIQPLAKCRLWGTALPEHPPLQPPHHHQAPVVIL